MAKNSVKNQLVMFSKFSEERQEQAESQIVDLQKIVDYEIREYTIELLIQKYDEQEIFIPKYQRKFVWDSKRQSKFIESLILGLPIPYMFLADNKDGRSEIVDGSQRIRTLKYFINNELVLKELEKLTFLEGFRFEDMPLSRQRRFKKRTMRLIELTDKADTETRKDVFQRINTTPVNLTEMEVRRGRFEGSFIEFIGECSRNEKFNTLCPISEKRIEREEKSEMILRFFAYTERYTDFIHLVGDFLDDYTSYKSGGFDAAKMSEEFENMLDFVDSYFPYGFRKTINHASTPRVRFEAIAVGVGLALTQKPDLIPAVPVIEWLNSDEFDEHTTSDAANNRNKLIGRIEFVRDKLLGNK